MEDLDVLELLDRPIAFHRSFIKIAGVYGALMLSQAIYWTRRTADPDGWFYKTREEWEDEIGLTRYMQESARDALKKAGLLEEERRGVPCQLYFRVNLKALRSLIANKKGEKSPTEDKVTNQSGENSPTDRSENPQQDCQPTTNLVAVPSPTLDKETKTTTENTTETTACAPSAAQTPPAAASLKFPKSFADPHWKAYFESKPIYAGIDLDFEREQMEIWCDAHHRKPSTRCFANWLTKCAQDAKATSEPLTPAEKVIAEVCQYAEPLTAQQRMAIRGCAKHLHDHRATTGQLREYPRYHHHRHKPGEPRRDPPRPEQIQEKWQHFIAWLGKNPKPLAVGEVKKVCETCHGRKRVFSIPGDIDSPKVPCPACQSGQGDQAKTKTEAHGDQLVA